MENKIKTKQKKKKRHTNGKVKNQTQEGKTCHNRILQENPKTTISDLVHLIYTSQMNN